MSLSFDIFKLAQDGVPVLLDAADNLDAAIAHVIALRDNFPGQYLIVSRGTGKKILFAASGGIKRD